MEGAMPAAEAEPGTLKVSLAATPRMSSPVSCSLCCKLWKSSVVILNLWVFFFLISYFSWESMQPLIIHKVKNLR